MKKTIFCLLSMLIIEANSQTPRLSLYEVFTGENNPPAATTNQGLNTLLSSPTNTPKIVAINWEVPIPSAPSATWSLFQTNSSDINWRYKAVASGGYGYQTQSTSTSGITQGINVAPYGLIDGQQQWVFGAISGHPTNMNNSVISTAQSFTSPFSVSISRSWNSNFTAVQLTVNIQASANFTSTGALVFRTVMVERQINFPTAPGSNGEKTFYDVAVASYPTLQAGVPMTSGWLNGQTQTFTLNCPIPSYIRELSEIAFVGFIQDDGNRKVIQTYRTASGTFSIDLKAVSLVQSPIVCNTAPIIPTLTVKNTGTSQVTSFVITPTVNGVASTGNTYNVLLAPGASTVITMIPFTSAAASPGNNILVCGISAVSGGDLNLSNNTAIVVFPVAGNPPVISVTSMSSPVCAGKNITIQASGASKYLLQPGSQQGGFLSVTPLVTTVYTISGFSANNCPSSNSVVLTVSVIPSPTVGILTSTPGVCSGSPVSLTLTGANSYTLMPGNLTGSTFTFNQFMTTLYSVKGTNTLNCVSINNTTAVVTVTHTPLVSLPNATICMGNTLTLKPAGAANYTLQPGNLSGNIFMISPTVTSSYSVTGANGVCLGNSVSAVITITNGSIPIVTTTGNSVICAGSAVLIKPSGATTYTLEPGGLTGPPFFIVPPASSTYSVYGTNSQHCISNIPALVSITVSPRPTITVSNHTVCAGNSITLAPAGAHQYTLSPSGLNGTSFVMTPTQSITYYISGKSIDNCNSVNTPSVKIQVTHDPLPTVNIAVDTRTICPGEMVQLTATGADTYTWSNAATSDIINDYPGSTNIYIVEGTSLLTGCRGKASYTQVVDPCTGIEQLFSGRSTDIFPSPTSDILIIRTQPEEHGKTLHIVDISGKSLLIFTIDDTQLEVNVRHLTKGLYFVRSSSGKTCRFVKN